MIGLRFNQPGFLAAFVMALPSLCCADFSLDSLQHSTRESCCHTAQHSPPECPCDQKTPVIHCCCQPAALTCSPVRMANNNVALSVVPVSAPEPPLTMTAAVGCGFADAGPPFRVLQCVWLN